MQRLGVTLWPGEGGTPAHLSGRNRRGVSLRPPPPTAHNPPTESTDGPFAGMPRRAGHRMPLPCVPHVQPAAPHHHPPASVEDMTRGGVVEPSEAPAALVQEGAAWSAPARPGLRLPTRPHLGGGGV